MRLNHEIEIRGFTAIYDTLSSGPANSDGTRGIVAAGAFAGMANHPCQLQIGHEPAPALATVDAGTLELFDTAHGLAFLAKVTPSAETDSEWLSNLRTFGCSAGGITEALMSQVEIKSQTVGRIESAVFDHIAIVGLPSYSGAQCWNAALDYPAWDARLQNAMDLWQQGYDLHLSGKATTINRKLVAGRRARATTPEAIAAENSLRIRLAEYGGRNPHSQLPGSAPAPKQEEESVIGMLLTSVDQMADRLIELEEQVAVLENKNG
jgi:phage head maturation protease